MSIQIIAEIGINHNGNLQLAKELIDAAKDCGANAVKFQKRTIEAVYTREELDKARDSPFGTTNGDLKRGLEFGREEFDAIEKHCVSHDIVWSTSCWDTESVAFVAGYHPPFLKIPSALITNLELLRAYRETGIPLMLSTGMSTWEEIDAAVAFLSPDEGYRQKNAIGYRFCGLTLLHCHSSYPSPLDEINLACINSFKERYGLPVGYSSHTVSPWPCLMAAVYGAEVIEFHLTLDRTMFGSDQAASLEPAAAKKLIQEIRQWEVCKGDGMKKVYESELPIKAKLRR
jgi:N-acetylneuraminate synthase